MQRLESNLYLRARLSARHSLTSARWRGRYRPTYTKSQQPIAYDTTNDVRRGKVYISILGNGRWELEES